MVKPWRMRRLAMRATSRAGFTLIELLVVIAIIALLVGILLPGLSAARKSAWRTQSASNLRQITIAAMAYREDNKGYMPITPAISRVNSPSALNLAWASFQFGGKNCDAYWPVNQPAYDILAADRQLNAYVADGVVIFAPPSPIAMAATDPNRKPLQIPVFRDPSDRESYQRSNIPVQPISAPISSYDDVGTSYHVQMKWYEYPALVNGRLLFNRQKFDWGTNRLRLSDAFQPSRMVWANDQYMDVVMNNRSQGFKLKNGFGDINKAVMAFMDGHVSYSTVTPGQNDAAFSNNEYTTIFDR
jgi:prepilin-type N-terminal cleavage/methylation domain-containing protein/prepilin-type processing-associated H-X9-DG protein